MSSRTISRALQGPTASLNCSHVNGTTTQLLLPNPTIGFPGALEHHPHSSIPEFQKVVVLPTKK